MAVSVTRNAVLLHYFNAHTLPFCVSFQHGPQQEGNKLQRQKILSFIYPIYNHNWRNISTIYIYIYKNILTIKQNTLGSSLGWGLISTPVSVRWACVCVCVGGVRAWGEVWALTFVICGEGNWTEGSWCQGVDMYGAIEIGNWFNSSSLYLVTPGLLHNSVSLWSISMNIFLN